MIAPGIIFACLLVAPLHYRDHPARSWALALVIILALSSI
jgi:hypothetical protein